MSSDENLKTLLVIGNGFDIAHELRTRYTDFLDFVYTKSAIGRSGVPQYSELPLFRKHQGELQSKLNKNALHLDDLFGYVNNIGNIWIGYFNTIRSKNYLEGRADWIDFEQEIETLIKQIEKLILRSTSFIELEEKLRSILGEYLNQPSETITQELVPRLNWDLKVLTLLLEWYLIEEENNLKVKHISFFKNLNPDVIINYNYTRTFQKLYDLNNRIPVHFIHGELEKHNLVLGIGETLSDNQKDTFTVCASFKKFFQRIKYRLGNTYKNIARDNCENCQWQIIIYGHSLDTTDSDSLRWLLLESQKFQTPVKNISIYYYDDNAYNQQIANAMQIIGKEELIDAVHSERIIFKSIDETIKI